VLCTSASVVGSCGHYIWLGLVAPASLAACVSFYHAFEKTASANLWALAASKGCSTGMVGPFNCTNGVYCDITGLGASALVALD